MESSENEKTKNFQKIKKLKTAFLLERSERFERSQQICLIIPVRMYQNTPFLTSNSFFLRRGYNPQGGMEPRLSRPQP